MKKKKKHEEQSRKQGEAEQTHQNECTRVGASRASTRATELKAIETKERRNEKPLTDETMHREGDMNSVSLSLSLSNRSTSSSVLPQNEENDEEGRK